MKPKQRIQTLLGTMEFVLQTKIDEDTRKKLLIMLREETVKAGYRKK